MTKITLPALLALSVLSSGVSAKENPAGHKSSVVFIENKGQILDQNHNPNNTVKYLLNSKGMNVQLRDNGFSYESYVEEQTNVKVAAPAAMQKIMESKEHPSVRTIIKYHRVDVLFDGANKNSTMVATDAVDYIKYYTNDLQGVKATTYKKVTYKDVYPGIDVEFISEPGKGSAVEYNFIVHPGADASKIKLRYNGASNTFLNEGKIVLKTAYGNVNEAIPASYTAGDMLPVNVQYTNIDDNTYGFAVGSYDKSKTLIIDPMPSRDFCTYYGGAGNEILFRMAMDGSGNVYLSGNTNSTTNMASSGAFQGSYAGGTIDAVLAKFNSSGVRQWATYYGGSGDDYGEGITTDGSGNVYMCGATSSSTGITTSGAWQTTYNSGYDAFVVKFDGSGNRTWGTYDAGSGSDEYTGIATDGTYVFVAGNTTSSGMASSGAFQTSNGGSNDIYIVRLSASTSLGNWATYYGGSGADIAYGVAIDGSSNIYVGGYVGTTGMASTGAHQTSFGGGTYDGFITKFNSSGSRQWATYWGGTDNDFITNIDVDGSNNVYACGTTASQANIASSGAYVTTNLFSDDGMVGKFNTNGVRQWSTYFGSGEADDLNGIDVDAAGNVYVTGTTLTSTYYFPATYGSLQYFNSNTSTTDGYFAKFNASGILQWCTLLGDYYTDELYDLRVNSSGQIFVTGRTGSSGGIATSGAHQTSYAGGFDGLFGRFGQSGCASVTINHGAVATPVSCYGNNNGKITCTPSGGATPYEYEFGYGGYSSSNSVASLSPGSYYVAVRDANGCMASTTVSVTQPNSLSATVSQTDPSCFNTNDGSVTINATGGTSPYTYQMVGGGTQTTPTFTSLAAGSYGFTLKDSKNCQFGGVLSATLTAPAAIVAGSVTGPNVVTAFSTKNYVVAAQSGMNYQWTVVGGAIASGQGTNSINVNWGNGLTGASSVKCFVYKGSLTCGDSATMVVSVSPTDINDVFAKEGIHVFPNPATDVLYINCDAIPANVNVELTDNYGRRIVSQPLQKQNSIKMEQLPVGIYYLQIGDKRTKITKL